MTKGIWRILTVALNNLIHLHFIGLLLTKVYNVWAKESTEELFYMVLNIDAKFELRLTWVFKNGMNNLASFSSQAENSNFILGSKMTELNQNKTWKEPDWPDAV